MARISVQNRLWLLTLLGTLGGSLFTPFILANPEEKPSALVVFGIFTLGSAVVTFLSGWIGLRWADRGKLPMPWLRGLEASQPLRPLCIREVGLPIVLAVFLGLGSVLVVRALAIPGNPGSFLERIATTVFASVVPEVLVHLFIMSGLVLLTKRVWLAVLLSSLLFVLLFHGNPPSGSVLIPVFVIGLNFSFGTLTGWAYATRGFEAAILSHAAAHFVTLAFN